MGEALPGVHAHAAPVRHEFSCVGRHRCRCLALHGNVSRRAVAVLAVGCAAHLSVVLGRPVGAVDHHRGGKMAADALQDHHQSGGSQNGVAAVLAGKFFHGEVGGQLFVAVRRLGIGVDLDHRFFSFRFACFFTFQLPYEEKRDHPPVPGDALPCRIHEAGRPASVHHNGVVPAEGRQQIPELLRRVPLPAHIVGEPPVLGADGRPGGAVAHIRSADDGTDLLPADDEVDALHVIPVPIGNGLHAEIRRGVPADGPRPVLGCLAGLPVSLQVAGGLLIPQENGAVADSVSARLRQHFSQVGRCGAETLPVEIDFQKLEVGERDGARSRAHVRASVPLP